MRQIRATTPTNGHSAAKPGRRLKTCLPLVLLFVAVLAVPHGTRSQTSTLAPGAAKPIPQRILYALLFRQVVLLDYQADAADQKGQDGNALRNYYQVHAGLTSTETALLKSTAHDAITALVAVNQQIQTAAINYRAQLSSSQWHHGQPLPPSAELQALQDTKDNVVLAHLATLQSGFGASRFQYLDNYVKATIAPNVAVSSLPAVGAPAKTSPPLLPVPWK